MLSASYVDRGRVRTVDCTDSGWAGSEREGIAPEKYPD